ncbi:hypothetical protein BaraCB756_29060 [Bradyrhizobium arachidis]|nr:MULTISPECIES: hypothetical protein [Bradyrhizobium]UFW53910.1 hypothetical protein BaraCB756_29060 [Bradyrhizobium arachidis]
MAGPSAIATTLLLSSAAGTTSRLVVVILLVCLTCVICFALAVPIVKHWATLEMPCFPDCSGYCSRLSRFSSYWMGSHPLTQALRR